jgi:uncharacterized protein DUF4038/malectin (di-glucose binding ER protein)/collagenase-like protein with putative collagen-binding domain
MYMTIKTRPRPLSGTMGLRTEGTLRTGIYDAVRQVPSSALWGFLMCLCALLGACSSSTTGDSGQSLTGEQALTTAVYQINSGGGVVGSFAADQFWTGGATYSTTSSISVDGVANAAPAAVYQSERFLNPTYTFGNLTPNAAYTVRLHFAEIYFTERGKRTFNVAINGARVLTELDIFATVGALKALVRDFPATATANGQITIQYTPVVDHAKSSAIEILSNGGATNQPPSIATPAAATPNPTTGPTSSLSVLGADDNGEAALTYTWSVTGTPPSPVTFSANGSNAAKKTTVTLGQPGTYNLSVRVQDGSGASVSSAVSVVLTSSQPTNQAPTVATRASATPNPTTGPTTSLSALGADDKGEAALTYTWSVVGTAPSPVTFSVNGSNAAKNTTATLGQPGSYDLSVKIQDASGASVSSATTVVISAVSGGALPRYPLKLAGTNSRYLVDQDGVPFLFWGDTAWSLIARPSLADAKLYLDNRQAKGVNVVLANLIDRRDSKNANGNPAFDGRAFTTPNSAYFAAADQVISAAAARGITVLLAPLYLGYSCGNEGWCPEVQSATLAEMRGYGQYIGQRYKSFDNIVWLIGGDTDPTPVADKLRQFVAGVREFDTRHLMSAHNAPESLATSPWPNESWLTVNNFYTYSSTLYTQALQAYQRTPVMPFFLIESTYENEHGATTQSLRNQAYWTMLSGAMGQVFGNCPIWNFNSPNWTGFCSAGSWTSQLNSAGATSMSYLRKVLIARPWQTLIPDTTHTSVTAGYGELGATNYVTAARASNGATLIAYLPSARGVTVNMTRVSGTSAKAWWLNPATNAATSIGTFSTQGSKVFTPPGSGDWLLVLDDASRGYLAPGQ